MESNSHYKNLVVTRQLFFSLTIRHFSDGSSSAVPGRVLKPQKINGPQITQVVVIGESRKDSRRTIDTNALLRHVHLKIWRSGDLSV